VPTATQQVTAIHLRFCIHSLAGEQLCVTSLVCDGCQDLGVRVRLACMVVWPSLPLPCIVLRSWNAHQVLGIMLAQGNLQGKEMWDLAARFSTPFLVLLGVSRCRLFNFLLHLPVCKAEIFFR
jgi:hypothetical protein